MSTKIANANATATAKKCCKLCKDSGKSEAVFSTHFVKDNKGKVICPTLLALNCRYCNASGHTVKFCKALEKKNKMDERNERNEQNERNERNERNTVPLNMFDLLGEDSDSDNEDLEEGEVVEEYPEIPMSRKIKAKQAKAMAMQSYAMAISKPVPVALVLPVLLPHTPPNSPPQSKYSGESATPYKFKLPPAAKGTYGKWASAESSDEEDDEEDESQQLADRTAW